MGLRLVNTFPGTAPEPVKPGQPVQLGLKSEGSLVELGTVRVTMGLTSIEHEGLLPEANPNLPARGASVVYDTPERVRPISATDPVTLQGQDLVFLKPSSAQDEKSIYEITSDIDTGASVLGYFRFLVNHSWDVSAKPWSTAPVSGVYLGLEHGEFNTACYAFLGNHVLVTGGPLQLWGAPRPSQQNLTHDWSALAQGTELEIWVYFNLFGYPTPFSPAYTPVAEVWARAIGVDAVPVRLCRLPVGTLGHFPVINEGTSNYRSGPSSTARLFFGFSGHTGESLILQDWALFPDYRVSVSEGEALPGSSFDALPDAPVEYRAEMGLPAEISPGRWMFMSDSGAVRPSASPSFTPGKKKSPTYTSLSKTVSNASGFEKQEPRLETREGFMAEAFLAGQQNVRASDQTGSGFLVEDGQRTFRAGLLATPTDMTVGLLTSIGTPDLYTTWLYPHTGSGGIQDVDWSSLKKVRITGDHIRGKASLYIEDEFSGEVDLSLMPAAAPGSPGRVAFGHLVPVDSTGELQVAYLNYLTRYQAWEGRDGLLPTAAPYLFTQVARGTVDTQILDDSIIISKKDFSVVGSSNYFSLDTDFDESMGVLVDFQAKVETYTNLSGYGFASPCWTGAGLELLLGTKKLHLGFFDCGTFGRKIGIIPGSGTVNDILNQTDLGRAFSAPVDWTEVQNYRLVYKAYDRIEVWVGNTAGQSVLTIPWTPIGFDLPEFLEPAAIRFGHFDSYASSQTKWGYVRFGQSAGYEVAVQHQYSEFPGYLFGGRVVVLPEFSE